MRTYIPTPDLNAPTPHLVEVTTCGDVFPCYIRKPGFSKTDLTQDEKEIIEYYQACRDANR